MGSGEGVTVYTRTELGFQERSADRRSPGVLRGMFGEGPSVHFSRQCLRPFCKEIKTYLNPTSIFHGYLVLLLPVITDSVYI